MVFGSNNTKPRKTATGLKRPKQFEASREEFLTAALLVFGKKGFHGASVDEIVTMAGRSKGGFYHHFQSKEQLYIEVFDQLLGSLLQKLELEIQSGNSIRTVFMKLISEFEPMMINTEQMRVTTNFLLASVHNSEAAQIIKYVHNKMVIALANLFHCAIEREEIHDEFDVTVVAELLLASGRGIVITSLICDDAPRIPDLLRTFVKVQLKALEVQSQQPT